ncbi:hypothetical protein CNEO3_510009 [Clostridium neonatale]|nr:hypothetical protein CNEO3_100090 [Clostridium neonatale]CAI3597944.1 hypothetical protein CNEO3_180044 [Clostridium neonatale]CAI3686376.1 hypothetical protein CNEO3_510009 [Clostridium neonatale]CAI3707694.1 hypothetical protein CNEO3_80091 [Clostridium neonatale]
MDFYKLTNVNPWIAQFAFDFYSILIISTLLGFISIILFKQKSCCVYCHIRTITQEICIIKNKSNKN